jgi:histidinol dehydrogenase
MKVYNYGDLSGQEINKLCARQNLDLDNVFKIVRGIADNIKKRGDAEIRDLGNKFDGVDLEKFALTQDDLDLAAGQVTNDLKIAIKLAKTNIEKFHATQFSENVQKSEKIETSKGVFCWREARAIENVGLYIPGGTAPLFSTLLMSAIPAQIAGCKNIILCTPPNPAPEILWTASLCGIKPENIFQIGGAQAILAMTYGTEQVPKVDKIFGPGNQFVTVAKMMVASEVAIDMPAGPSEVLVIADEKANAKFVTADLLSQAEHGVDSQAILVSNSEIKIHEILAEVKIQLTVLSRQKMAQKSLDNSYAIVCDNLADAIKFSNIYAPEHLILNVADEVLQTTDLMKNIVNAGSVFVGKNACESFGDYASGTNHILPTSGFAKNFSGVSVDSFIKKITFQEISDEGVNNLGPAVELMAAAEELQAHKNAVSVRLESLKNI